MKPELDVYGLCRDFITDNSRWLGPTRTKWLHGLCRSKSLLKLSAIASDPRARITCARDMGFYLQVEAFFKKNAAFTDKTIARTAAETNFAKAERICRITNKRLDYYYAHPDRLDPELRLLIARTTQWVERILGEFRPFLDQIPDLVRVTSGATATTPRNISAPPLKMKRHISCYPGTQPYLQTLLRLYGLEKMCKTSVATWNRVEFVAKNWKTDRTIACEQEGSLCFQLAFDTYVKRRLRKYGIDLSDQSSNQEDARLGSIYGTFATVDMSMASDTVAYNTVAWLFPEPWFNYLCAHRASHYLMGSLQKYAKFSSMGNGATFGIETLVFTAMARACGSTKGHIYGDDVTIEPQYLSKFFRLLTFFGFVPNTEKTCLRGPYRESCGHHYYNGKLVTPFFVRSTDRWDAPNAAHNVNGLSLISTHGELWRRLKRFVAENKLLLVPYSERSNSGVHLHPTHCYRLGLYRWNTDRFSQALSAKQYYTKDPVYSAKELQGLMLWYFRNVPNADKHEAFRSLPQGSVLSSVSYTNGLQRKYRRRWGHWQPPVSGQPEELFTFSDFLTA